MIVTTQYQKVVELTYAKKAGELLGQQWSIEPSPNELHWPDLIVRTESEKFGLEVREIYLDESRKGSRRKAAEAKNEEIIRELSDSYYNAGGHSIKADFLGDIDDPGPLFDVITEEVPLIAELEHKRIEAPNGCVIYVRKLPSHFGEYKRWRYISDRVGWVGTVGKALLDKVIEKKAKNLPRYTKNISNVALLIVSDRIYNSGKAKLTEDAKCDPCGFRSVYYLSYPEEALRLNSY